MEWNSQTRGFLSQCFLDTLSPESESRRRAVKKLSDAADKPNYGLSVLQLVAQPAVDKRIRQLAAVNFKNHVIARWKPSSGTPISDDEKKHIKQLVVSLLHVDNWESTLKMQSELKEAIKMIAKLDYRFMEATLHQLKSSLKKAIKVNDFACVNDILTTVDLMFEKLRYPDKCDGIMSYLYHCLDNFAAPLLTTVKSVSVKINATAARSTPALLQLIETQRLCCRIFHSLNFLVLPDVFVYNVDKWMNEFRKYLTTRYPCIENSDADGVALVDELYLAVFRNIILYMEKDEKLFQKYLSGFVEAVLSLLVESSASQNRGRLNIAAIMFLTIVCNDVHHALFAGDDMLQQIIESIVIPNVMVTDEDEELFKKNYVKFIRRDMERSGVFTRGRIACELLKGIARNYKEKVTIRVSKQIHNCLALFAENPTANWKYKYCAIYLVIYLASMSADLVDVDDFFLSVIVPELEGEDVNAFPMLKAGALKFFSLFWVQIPKPADMALLYDVVRFLCSNVNVVHSYAAIFLEKFLVAKDLEEQARFTAVDIDPILPVLMTNLFRALEKPKSEENKYIMMCIMRVLQIADISPQVASICSTYLTTVLNRVCEKPKSPVFNRCLFEAVATLVKIVCEKNPSFVHNFESWIIPSLQLIQAKGVLEFFPYAFQLYAQLVDFKQPPFSPQYISLLDMLLKPDMFNTSEYLPASVRLLQSFIQRTPDELNKEGRLRRVLDIFNKLVSSPNNEEHAFPILYPLIENLEYDGLAELMNYIWPSVSARLRKSKTPMLVKCLIIFLSLFLVKHGRQTLVDSINAVQAQLYNVVLGQFWITNLKTITGPAELKLIAVAATKLLWESILLLDPAGEELMGKLLNGIVTLLSQPEEKRVDDEPEVLYFGGETGYQASFVPLSSAGKTEDDLLKEINDPKHYSVETDVLYFEGETGHRATYVPLLSVGKKQVDPLKEINDPKDYLVALLANLSSLFPGRFPPIISRYLSPANQAALLQLCNSYDVTIV